MYLPDARLDPRFAGNPLVTGPPSIRSYLGVPLSSTAGYNLGALCAIDTKPRTYTAAQIDVLRSFGDIVVDEMELCRIAQVDQLTGALTRRAFRQETDKAISSHLRHNRPTTLVILDIDHFKHVNDTYGHPAGDLVLKFVSNNLMKLLRNADAFGRLGGEEFGIIFSEADSDQAKDKVERLRLAVESLRIEHDPPFGVTASFGFVTLDQDC